MDSTSMPSIVSLLSSTELEQSVGINSFNQFRDKYIVSRSIYYFKLSFNINNAIYIFFFGVKTGII